MKVKAYIKCGPLCFICFSPYIVDCTYVVFIALLDLKEF